MRTSTRVSRDHRPRIHLVNPLWDATGGADWRTIDTWRLLRSCADVQLWSEYAPAAAFDTYPIRRIRPVLLDIPRGGTLVFVGTYFRIGHWVRLACPDRVILIYNTDQPDRLEKNLRRLSGTRRSVEIVYTSKALRRRHRGNGCVLESPVDVTRFRPWRIVSPARPFTIGRLSRDIRSKHHEDDPALWRRLVGAGCRIRIMGGTCLADELGDVPNVELLPAGAEDAASFLRSLDCFVYRTSERWFEAYGRVVIEAMATGLPIVAAKRGGYADGLRDGMNGLLFDCTDDAVDRVLALRSDRRRALCIGHAARQSAVELNVVDLPHRTVAFLTNGAVMAPDTVGLRAATT